MDVDVLCRLLRMADEIKSGFRYCFPPKALGKLHKAANEGEDA